MVVPVLTVAQVVLAMARVAAPTAGAVVPINNAHFIERVAHAALLLFQAVCFGSGFCVQRIRSAEKKTQISVVTR